MYILNAFEGIGGIDEENGRYTGWFNIKFRGVFADNWPPLVLDTVVFQIAAKQWLVPKLH